MLSLINLEIKKFNLVPLLAKVFVIMNMAFIVAVCAAGFVSKMDGEPILTDYAIAFSIIDALIRASFIVFAAILLSILVIDEFKNKTMNVLASYPVGRKKIMAAKLMIVVVYTFAAILLSSFITISAFCLISENLGLIPRPVTFSLISEYSARVPIYAMSASLMSLIPLYFGLIKYSVPATIVTSFLVVSLVSSNFNGLTLMNVIVVPAVLSVTGLIIASMTIRKVENIDLHH